MLAGARPEAVAGALGSSVEEAYQRWRERALRQCNFIIGSKLGITEEAYEEVARRFASAGI